METLAIYINSLPRRITSAVFRKICLDVFEDLDRVPLMMRGYYAYTPHGTAGNLPRLRVFNLNVE